MRICACQHTACYAAGFMFVNTLGMAFGNDEERGQVIMTCPPFVLEVCLLEPGV